MEIRNDTDANTTSKTFIFLWFDSTDKKVRTVHVSPVRYSLGVSVRV